MLYVGFGGDGNKGLLLAYDANTLAQRAVWVVTPTGNGAGLWQSGQAPAIDANGRVYFMTGNGTFDAHTGGSNYGDSFVKLALQNHSLVVEDYFAPCNQRWLDSIDHDLGSAGPILIPNTNLVAGAGKQGRLYLLNRANMGKHRPSATPGAQACANTNTVQEFQATQSEMMSHVHSAPLFWRGPDASRIYLWGEHDRLRAYAFANGRFQANAPRLGSIPPADGMPGGMLSLSSNGQRAGTGIVWAVTPRDGDANTQRGVQGLVVAMDAQDVSRTLWTSEQVAARDRLGLFAKFTPPTVAGGKVFVATYGDQEPKQTYAGGGRPQQLPGRYYIAVYGLLDDKPFDVINQDRADITVLRAAAEGPLNLDSSRCPRLDDGTADCTAEFERTQGAPSLHRVMVPQGHAFPGCRLLRVTTASKTIAARNSANLGFYSADATGGQLSASRGWTIAKTKLKEVGFATLQSGEPATLHEFVGIVGCQIDAATVQSKVFKPFVDFQVAQDRLIYRNWDVSPNYTISTAAPTLDRSAAVLAP